MAKVVGDEAGNHGNATRLPTIHKKTFLEKRIMKTQTKHNLIDLKEQIDYERDKEMTATRIVYTKEHNLLKQDLTDDLKAIRTAYREKYKVEKQRAVNNEKQDE